MNMMFYEILELNLTISFFFGGGGGREKGHEGNQARQVAWHSKGLPAVLLLETQGQQLMVGQRQTNQCNCRPGLRALNVTPQGSSAPPSCAGLCRSHPHTNPRPTTLHLSWGLHSDVAAVNSKLTASRAGSSPQPPPAGQDGGSWVTKPPRQR